MPDIIDTLARTTTLLGLVFLIGGCDSSQPAAPTSARTYSIAVTAGIGERRFTDDTVPIAVVIQLRDSAGNPGAGVAVRFAAMLGGGHVTDTLLVSDSSGKAQTGWRLGTLARQQQLAVSLVSARGSPVTVAAQGVDPRDADFVIVNGAEAQDVTLAFVALGDSGGTALARHVTWPDTIVRLLPTDSVGYCQEIFAFARGKPPALAVEPWTSGPDTVQINFAAPFQVPLTIWIGDQYDQTLPQVNANLAALTGIWFDFGLVPGAVTIRNATGFFANASCANPPAVRDSGVVNVYYASDVQIDQNAGFTCSNSLILMKSLPSAVIQQSNVTVLAHELGHTFSLAHELDPKNFMYANSPGGYTTLDQVVAAHFLATSSLNGVYGLRADETYMYTGPLGAWAPSTGRRLDRLSVPAVRRATARSGARHACYMPSKLSTL